MTEDAGRALEAILFVSDEPLAATVLAQALDVDRRAAEQMLDELSARLEERGSGLVLRNVAGGWQLFTHADAQSFVERFVLSSRHTRLTKASLETLAIVAYKQPVTRHQIAAIRGVNSDGVLKSLMDRGLLTEVGREEVPGRPVLYGTTPEFLQRLGVPSLTALPSLAPLLDAVDGDEESEAGEAGEGGAPAPLTAESAADLLEEEDEAGELGSFEATRGPEEPD
ncbi:MAG: SMC-Scp complex subunit ScpB [Actinomycetota bacterium]